MGISTKYSLPVSSSNKIWVDDQYGDDSTGQKDRRDLPYKTINAAWNAVNNSNGFIIYIADGTYLIDSTIIVPKVERVIFKCESTHGVIINSTAARIINDDGTGGWGANRADVVIDGGTWNHNGANTGFEGFNVLNFYIYNANINNNTGSGCVYSQTLRVMDNCRVINTVGFFIVGASAGNPFGTVIKNSYIECASNMLHAANARIGINYTKCKLISLTAGINFQSANFVGSYHDCIIECAIQIWNTRGGAIYLNGINNLKRTLNGANVILVNGTTYNFQLNIETLIISSTAATATTNPNINKVGRRPSRMLVSDVVVSPNVFGNGYFSPSGRIGTSFAATTTVGTDITMNLPTPYNTDLLTYTITSTDSLTTVTALKSIIDNRITTQGKGNPWWDITQGDTSLVRIIGTQGIIVDFAANSPMGHQISLTAFYISGVDQTFDYNAGTLTFVEMMGGEYRQATNEPLVYGGTERLVDKILPLETYRTN